MMAGRRGTILAHAVTTVFAFLSVYPLINLIAIAMRKPGSLVGSVPLLPDRLSFENFSRAWSEAHLGPAFVTSCEIAVLSVVLTVVVAVMAGYAFGTMRFPGSELIFGILLLGLVIPTEAQVVPLYYDLRSVGLTNTIWGVVLPQTAAGIAFGTFWMRSFFASVPREITEAALVDGARTRSVLWTVLLPTARPAVQTLALLVFLSSFNDFLLPLIMLQGEGLQTVPLTVASYQGPHLTDQTGVAAVALLACIPVVLVFLALQRRLIEGLTAGAVKG
jgi:raffinose/stachyose/melibiose transport system permease protein